MAIQTYTLADLQDAVKHAIGGTPSSQTDTTEIVNNALDFLANAHPWSWRRKWKRIDFSEVTITSLVRASDITTVTKTAHGLAIGDTVRISSATTGFDGVYMIATVPTADSFTIANAGDDETAADPGVYITGHVALPSDFESMESLAAGSITLNFEPSTIDHINQLRMTNTGTGGWGFYYDIGWSAQAAATAAPIARLELYPVPSEARSDVARLLYRKALNKLSGSTDLPDIPAPLHGLLKQLCRQFATQDEDQDEWKKIEGTRAKQMLDDAIANDTRRKPVAGRLKSQLGGRGYSSDAAIPMTELTI